VTRTKSILRLTQCFGLIFALSACGGSGSNPFGSIGSIGSLGGNRAEAATQQAARTRGVENVAVNRYLWAASLDVLNFLPVESVDPFTGVIVMGYGTPPGGSRAYRATIFISDPALDARCRRGNNTRNRRRHSKPCAAVAHRRRCAVNRHRPHQFYTPGPAPGVCF